MTVQLRRRFPGHGITQSPPGRYFDELSDLYAGKLILVLDISWSMKGSRIQGATAGARELLAIALGDSYLVGLVTFCEHARTLLDLTTDLGEVDRAIQKVALGSGTDMSTGIALAHRLLKERRGERVMAIFSDGETDQAKAIRAAEAAKRDGIRIIGAPGGDADPGLMRKIVSEEQPLERVEDSQIKDTITGLAHSLQATWQPRNRGGGDRGGQGP